MSDFDLDIDLDSEALQHCKDILGDMNCDIHKELPRYEVCNGVVRITACCEEFESKINVVLNDNNF
ncbi:hypothetical protein [Photobacterium leiognathi]|uniref:hypothetical protein n=1 Tax=Photobacterium leiognathi TaxID=553611 RepID=UPI00298238EC|nr:hypothetical protein [Photobacterium leiognathi]